MLDKFPRSQRRRLLITAIKLATFALRAPADNGILERLIGIATAFLQLNSQHAFHQLIPSTTNADKAYQVFFKHLIFSAKKTITSFIRRRKNKPCLDFDWESLCRSFIGAHQAFAVDDAATKLPARLDLIRKAKRL